MTKTRVSPDKERPKATKVKGKILNGIKNVQKHKSSKVKQSKPSPIKAEDAKDLRVGKVGKYHTLRTLGSGSSSIVKLAVDRKTQETFALKLLVRPQSDESEKLDLWRSEVEAVRRMDHKHVTKYHHFEESATYENEVGKSTPISYIVMELSQRYNLFDFVAGTG